MGLTGGDLEGANAPRQGGDLRFVQADERAQDRLLYTIREDLQILQGLAGHLTQGVPRDQGFGPVLVGDLARLLKQGPLAEDASPALSADAAELLVGPAEDLLVIQHNGVHVPAIGVTRQDFAVVHELGQLHLALAEVDGDHHTPPPHDHPGSHGRINAARDQGHRPPLGAQGQPPVPGHRLAKEQSVVPAHLYADGQVGLVREVDPRPGRRLDVSADQAVDLKRGQGKSLVCPAALHPERPLLVQANSLGHLQSFGPDGFNVSLNLLGRTQGNNAEDVPQLLDGPLHILNLHVDALPDATHLTH